MASPFPGMDPYLEHGDLWASFHHQLINCLCQLLIPALVDRYRARVEERHYTTHQELLISAIPEEHHEE